MTVTIVNGIQYETYCSNLRNECAYPTHCGRTGKCRQRQLNGEKYNAHPTPLPVDEVARRPVGWLIRGETTTLYVELPEKPKFTTINGGDRVVGIDARYAE